MRYGKKVTAYIPDESDIRDQQDFRVYRIEIPLLSEDEESSAIGTGIPHK